MKPENFSQVEFPVIATPLSFAAENIFHLFIVFKSSHACRNVEIHLASQYWLQVRSLFRHFIHSIFHSRIEGEKFTTITLTL